ncbi:MAG: 4Fe-4S binding protein [Spirochaetes bacterium]|nr:4Fe-4S binding protein [Spirochaetota bacterium]MBN2771990.1 4Fe-4S binding protein [Spirochaetota bacterium]
MSAKTPFKSFIAAPLMLNSVLIIASLVFVFVLKETTPVPIFIIFMLINTIFMTLYALVPLKYKNGFRLANMLIIGSFLFFLAQLLGRQNFQIEGFFFYLFAGVIGGVMVNYANGKIIGPLISGRSWCGWNCWTVMFLDLLPWKKNTTWQTGGVRYIKYIMFALSLALTAVLVLIFKYTIVDTSPEAMASGTRTALIWGAAGNILYYVIGIALAVSFKDNRAFCKYACPVSLFLKASNKFALLKIGTKKEKCTDCKTCSSVCPMSIDIPAYVKDETRVLADECIMCMKCVSHCPENALFASVGLDVSKKNILLMKS